jgi:hypothetical protein
MEDEIGWERGKHGTDKKFKVLYGRLEGRGRLGDVAVLGRILWNHIL